MSMNMGPKAVYWYKNQVAITYLSDLLPTAPEHEIAKRVTDYRTHLNSDVLEAINYELVPYSSMNAQQSVQGQAVGGVDGLDGVYLFGSPNPPRLVRATDNRIIIFYHIVPKPGSMAANSMEGMGSMPGDGGSNGMGTDNMEDHTLAVVNHLHQNKGALNTLGVTSFDAMPHWFHAGTDLVSHGCPITPPIPEEDDYGVGMWKIDLQELSDPSLQDRTGDGVTVFVLDTLPTTDQMKNAANTAGNSNLLLQDMYEQNVKQENIRFTYREVPDSSQTAVTGKDIYGRMYGFPMADHGLFIAGIIHDLAPKAKIECVRVLNDFGVGDLNTLAGALRDIHNRMSKDPETGEEGNLYGKPVVINLSLVLAPPKNDLSNIRMTQEEIDQDIQGLHKLIQGMVKPGLIIVASAGNDTDSRDSDENMNPQGVRYDPRYPAAFAYYQPDPILQVLPVGAVNQYGEAASYSNQPGSYGIGAYGGEPPTPYPPFSEARPGGKTEVDPAVPIDALCGVYTASTYPALSKDDKYPPVPSNYPETPQYEISNNNAWAYWAGTSFAAPVISALAARIMQGNLFEGDQARQAILSTAPQRTTWTRLESGAEASGPMIMATQSWQPEAAAPQKSKES
jgi:Subtilase family